MHIDAYIELLRSAHGRTCDGVRMLVPGAECCCCCDEVWCEAVYQPARALIYANDTT